MGRVASILAWSDPDPRFLIMGSGEMAELVRTYDWSATPLGPLATWSKELVATINLMLASPMPAALHWGPDFIMIYNDGYRSLAGPRPHES